MPRKNKTQQKIFGLTGGIASGKSLVTKIFQEEGIPVIDADAVSRGLSAPGGAAAPLIEKRFGTLDRNEIRERVFQDAVARSDLEKILHPLIKIESEKQIARLLAENPQAPFLIYEAALLIESGRYRDFDGLIVISCPSEVRLQRLLSRSKMEEDLGRKIIASQLSEEERKKKADFLIENVGSHDELRLKVRDLKQKLSQ